MNYLKANPHETLPSTQEAIKGTVNKLVHWKGTIKYIILILRYSQEKEIIKKRGMLFQLETDIEVKVVIWSMCIPEMITLPGNLLRYFEYYTWMCSVVFKHIIKCWTATDFVINFLEFLQPISEKM